MNMLIVGGNKYLDGILKTLIKKDNKITLVNNSNDYCKEVFKKYKILVICGMINKNVLEVADIKSKDVILTMMEEKEKNKEVCKFIKKEFGINKIIVIDK